jgi:hypothetical protein
MGRDSLIKLAFIAGIVLMSFWPTLADDNPTTDVVPTVAVLDLEAGAKTPGQWLAGAPEFIEMSLQKAGVATLERRQIRLVLGERGVWQSGLISPENVTTARLPLPGFFIEGSLRQVATNRFSIEVSLVHARTATLEASFTETGVYPEEWVPALGNIARQAATRLLKMQSVPFQPTEPEAISWVPESAFKFFQGIERYGACDYGDALASFHELRMDDRNSKPAWLWEARCYKQCGLPDQADLILRKLRLADLPVASNALGVGRPVVAVLAMKGIDPEVQMQVAQRLADSGKFAVFDPAWIGATAREIDLQLTGEMAASLNDQSIWLAVDSAILLDVVSDGNDKNKSLRLRQQNLLSGKITYEASLKLNGSNPKSLWQRLAGQFLEGGTPPVAADIPLRMRTEPDERSLEDSPTTVLAKALRLVQRNPSDPKWLIGLADCYSPWVNGLNYLNGRRQYPMDYYQKLLCLDRVINEIEQNKEQPRASFWLASALWRKRVTRESQPWKQMIEGDRWQVSFNEEFKPLRDWFPQSEDTIALQQSTNSAQAPAQYLKSVFHPSTTTTVPSETAAEAAKSDAIQNTLFELRRQVQQTNYVKAYTLFWILQQLGASQDTLNNAFPQIQQVYDAQENLFREFNRQTEKMDSSGRLTDTSERMMQSCSAELRMYAIRTLADAVEKREGHSARIRFLCNQVQSWLEDFGPMADSSTLSWVQDQLLMTFWKDANKMSDARQYQDSERCYQIIHDAEYVPQAKRLTAAYDLAGDDFKQQHYFEATELLREIVKQTENNPVRPDRAYTGSYDDLHQLAFSLLKKARLFGDAKLDMKRCCGSVTNVEVSDTEENRETEKLFREWENVPSNPESGSEKDRRRAALVARGSAILPVLIQKLEKNEGTTWQLMRVFTDLGPQAAPAIPYVAPLVSGLDHGTAMNALDALSKIGRPAACTLPILILTAEQEDPYLRVNAEWAIRKVGVAPPRVVPCLAQLLDHPNPDVRLRAAKAVIASAKLPRKNFSGKKDDELVAAVRNWWQESGSKQTWELEP